MIMASLHPSRTTVLSLVLVVVLVFTSGSADAKKNHVKKSPSGNNPHVATATVHKGENLESKAVIEPGCAPIKAVKELKPEFINQVPSWYVPIASKHFYYRWGEELINRSLSESELPNLCMKWLYLSPTTPKGKYNVLIGGYHHAVVQLCQDTGYLTQTCDAIKTSQDYHKGADTVSTIVATDNKQWFMMARCIQKKYKDWAIFTVGRQTLTPTLQQELINEVKGLGFDIRYVETAPYQKCIKKV